MDDKASRQSGPLRIIHLGIPPAGNAGQRTQEGRASSLRSHAECERQRIRAHAEIKIRAAGNPADASPQNGLSELPHFSSPICKTDRPPLTLRFAGGLESNDADATNLSNVAMTSQSIRRWVPAARGYLTFL